MNTEKFHPGHFFTPTLSLKTKVKVKRCHVNIKKPVFKLNRLYPLHLVEESYQVGFLMNHFSISNTYIRNIENAALLKLYETTPLLQPYIRKLKETFQRRGVWCFRNQLLRTAFKQIAQRWLYKKYKNRLLNTVDVATLEEPKNAIHVYDAKAKGMYIFEATTLKRSIDSDLTFTDWLFPEPQMPKNAWTNCPFTIAQLIRIQSEFYKYELASPYLEGLKRSNWCLVSYLEIYKIPIKLEGLKTMLRNKTSEEYIVMMCEFIEDEHEYHEIDYISHLIILKWAVSHCASDPYMLTWSKLFEDYNRICILNMSRVLDRGDLLFDRVHDDTHTVLHANREIARLGRERLCTTARR